QRRPTPRAAGRGYPSGPYLRVQTSRTSSAVFVGEARARRYDGPSGRRDILLSLTQADGRPLAWAELLRAVGAGANCPRSTVLGPRSSVLRLCLLSSASDRNEIDNLPALDLNWHNSKTSR